MITLPCRRTGWKVTSSPLRVPSTMTRRGRWCSRWRVPPATRKALMVALPETPTPTRDAIFAAYEADREDGFRPSRRLADRQILRARTLVRLPLDDPGEFPGRILRLFETGQLEEARLVKNLRRTGATVLEVDPRPAGSGGSRRMVATSAARSTASRSALSRRRRHGTCSSSRPIRRRASASWSPRASPRRSPRTGRRCKSTCT